MIKKTNLLIYGLGISGRAALKSLENNNSINIFAYDDNINEIDDLAKELRKLNFKCFFTLEELNFEKFDLVMKSPGIKPSNPLIVKLKDDGSKIISDIELGYIYKNDEKIIAVTGTNGKTTTTTLIDEIIRANNISSKAAGNIGVGAVSELIDTKNEYLVIECSSFQLDDIDNFKPDVGVITNISVDHLDYHLTVENYIKAKLKILKNMNVDSNLVLNYDDKILKNLNLNCNIIFISGKDKLKNGFYYEDMKIYEGINGENREILDCNKINVKGLHNYYNIMCVLGVAKILNLDENIVRETIYKFKGVKHRLQFIRKLKGVSYYNDSKGTNTDSTIKALASFNEPIVVILGGYDKNEDFTEMLEFGKGRIKAIIALGATREKIISKASELGYKDLYIVDNLKDAVETSIMITEPGNILLLSPACASWDQFRSFEERGNEFIKLVENL